ncbi:radical SAM protein [Microbacterium sp. RURRCA19A]|uniref:7-carboxy-7-deazaguanine synthase QueE n=1 Tax=Microbacterium sp. RURRCA19A TaxID=1907391 RepID=UPI000955F3C3|nr:7-cyano-7-deazaguanosine (preQ0) biosynthesis protein QueE [Microbacterium sp. RURRCA19A]
MADLPIAEIFGPTIQGEGPYAGRRATFVRLGGCNLSCSWCDTSFTWDSDRHNLRDTISPMPVDHIVEETMRRDGVVVVTGGEPLLHHRSPAFYDLLTTLRSRGRQIHLETNGTIYPGGDIVGLFDVISLSPKLANAGPHRGSQSAAFASGWGASSGFTEIHLKIVCESREDVSVAASFAKELGWRSDRVWVMPQGIDARQLESRWPTIAQAAVDFGVNATNRLHVLAWGDERGR